MRPQSRLVVLAAICLGLAGAAPPPAPDVPVQFRTKLDGYDVGSLYVTWASWLQERQGRVADAMIREAESLPGEETYGRLVAVRSFGDPWHYASSDVRIYCAPQQKNCHYRLRRAIGAADAAPVVAWRIAAFDPATLVARVKAVGVAPGGNAPLREDVFGVLPSPEAVLRANSKLLIVDSRDCPAMGAAAAAFDRARRGKRPPPKGELGPDVPHNSYDVFYLPPTWPMRETSDLRPTTSARIKRQVWAIHEKAYACLDAGKGSQVDTIRRP